MEQQDKPTLKPVLVLPLPPSSSDPKPLAKIQKEDLADYIEGILSSRAAITLPKAWDSLERRLDKDDPKAFEQAAQAYGIIKSNGGVAVNILTQNNNSYVDAGAGFEKIVRQLEKRDRPENDDHIIDAEVVEDGD